MVALEGYFVADAIHGIMDFEFQYQRYQSVWFSLLNKTLIDELAFG